MKKIMYINGSPRGEKSSSSALILKDIGGLLTADDSREEDTEIFTLPRNIKKETLPFLETMNDADIWIIALPLYFDVLPGHLTWWLQEYQRYRVSRNEMKKIRVYGIINCGFPEAEQNTGALRVLEIFCRKCGLEWRFGIGLGMGEPYKQMHGIPLGSRFKSEILASYKAIARDLKSEESTLENNYFVRIKYPRFLYRIQGAWGWVSSAKKNGVSRKALHARPLQEG